MQPIDIVSHSGTSQDKQVISMAAAAVYGQAYNAARTRGIGPTDARAEARAAAQDFLNMDFRRE